MIPKELRASRRSACLCTECGAGLAGLVDWTSVRCPECYERIKVRADRYRHSERGRAVRNAYKRKRYGADPRAFLDQRNALRGERKQAGLCIWCGQVAADDSNMCPQHRDSHRAASLRWYHKTKQKEAA
jgi:predicted RNA-binding Zn-ribbon protein involved in translation (DUF1610 family)